jgi:hypothetical protein
MKGLHGGLHLLTPDTWGWAACMSRGPAKKDRSVQVARRNPTCTREKGTNEQPDSPGAAPPGRGRITRVGHPGPWGPNQPSGVHERDRMIMRRTRIGMTLACTRTMPTTHACRA